MPLHYRLRIRNATDTADDLVVTSIPEGVNPYIAEDGIPEGDGQTLNPVTGEVVAGTMTVGVVDVITDFSVDELVASDGFEYVDQAAMEAAGYVFVDTFTGGAWAVGATDQVYAGTRSLKAAISGGDGELKSTKTWTAADGIQPLRQYVVFARVRAKNRDWFDVGAKLYVTGSTGPTEAAVTVANEFQLLRVVATSTVDAELTTQLYRNGGFGSAEDTWFDALEIWTHTTGEGRIVTSRLADAQGRQQLLSRRAFLEETPDGVTFPVLQAGYVTMCELTTAMRYTIGVGESRRVEASVRVFEVAEPGFDRVSCILGGPVIGDFGPIPDLGRPRFQVVDTGEAGIVVLQWTGGELYQPLGEATPGIDASEDSNNLGYFNALANQYLGEFDGGVGQPFPDLVVRLMDIETGPGVTSNPPTGANGFPVLTADEADFTPVSSYSGGLSLPGALAYDLIGETDRIRIRWPVGLTEPDNGDRCKLVVFPRTISERNPLHWRGHPMDLATGLMTLRGQPFDAASAAAVRTELGDTLLIELRITAGMTLKEALETFVYGPFGVAPRVNDAGEYEFITTRHRPSDPPVTTITLDDLVSYDPTAWRIEESSAVNKVTFKTKAFTPISGPPRTEGLNRDPGNPIDYIRATDVPVEATPNPSDFEIYGERSVTYALPGRLLNVERFSFVAAVAAELFEERGRGAIVSQLAVRRDGPDPRLGEETILNLPHLPTANPTQSPVSQRGTTPRIAVVIRRTPTPAGPLLTVVDRGIALQASLIPEFTLVPSTGEPRKIATLAITNGVALAAAGVTVRIEWAVSSGTPITGQLLRTLDPATDALTFDLPAVDAGARVWARLRTEKVGTRPGTWSAFDDADLTDLDAPTSFAGTLSGGFIDLTWTLGANATDIPIEILLREDAIADFDSVVILPIGSTQYRLQLPTSETDYVIGVRHREAAPFAGVSPTTTLAVTSEAAVGLTAPINPAVFADGRGTFGLEVTATVLPSGTEFWVATETAPGSGVHDTSAAVQLVESVADGRTRFTNPSIAANDGKLRYLKARHVVGEATSDFCAELGIEPWLLLPPIDPDPDPDPVGEGPIGLTATVFEIVGHRSGTTEWGFAGPSAGRTPLAPEFAVGDWAELSGGTGLRLTYSIPESTCPAGASVGWDYKDAAGDWQDLGPALGIDPTTIADADEDGVMRSPWVALPEDAATDVRVRPVKFGGDGTGTFFVTGIALQVRSVAANGPADELPTQPPEVASTGAQYIEQTGGVGVTVPVGFFQAFEAQAVPNGSGEVTVRAGFFHSQVGGGYTRIGYFDNLKIVDADGVTLWSDGMEYADIAALLAAGWTAVDTMGAVSTASISETETTEGASALKIEVTGTTPAMQDCYFERTVGSLPVGEVITFSADVYENEEAEGSVGIACGIEIDSAGQTGIGDSGNDPLPDPPPTAPGTPGVRPFGAYGIPAAGFAFWNATVKGLTPGNTVTMLNTATTAGAYLFLRFALNGNADWLDASGKFSRTLWKQAVDAVYNNTGTRAALQAAIASGVGFRHLLMDEPHHPTRYGGPIPQADVEWCGQYSKSLYPTWKTMIATRPDITWYITRKLVGVDTLQGDYCLPRGDPTTFRDNNLALSAGWGYELVLGIHYDEFLGAAGTPRPPTPSEVRHYGGIMASTGATVANMGWRYTNEMWSQPGMPDAVEYVRDLYLSFD